MTNVSAVIGANYGDEGKGLVTDYLSTPDSLVVRFNGGAQAGHTVVTSDGRRHVFHHFGSGTFQNAATFLSRYFILNPILFARELAELGTHGLRPHVMLDRHAPVTSPYDMMLNRAVERARGTQRHGSCGMGINETIQRHAQPPFRLDLDGVLQASGSWSCRASERLRAILRRIRSDYVPQRETELGVAGAVDRTCGKDDEGVLEHYIHDVECMVGHCSVGSFQGALTSRTWQEIVFEGAQGLRLDMDSHDFPYVTPSKTGMTNVLALMQSAGLRDPVNAYYVTRTYVTRHGTGPLPHEVVRRPYAKVDDPTNIANEFQGALRFGWLEPGSLVQEICRDLSQACGAHIIPHLAVTCVDQLDGNHVHIMGNGGQKDLLFDEVFLPACRAIDGKGLLVTRGPTRRDAEVRGASAAMPRRPRTDTCAGSPR